MTKSDTGSELVFVYGTLRRGGSNAFRMDGAEFVGAGKVEGRLYVISWYPGLVLGEGSGTVAGDLFRVGSEQMRALDEFEGLAEGQMEGSEYRRVRAEVFREEVPHDEPVHAWVYEWKEPLAENRVVRSGDWFDYLHPRPAP